MGEIEVISVVRDSTERVLIGVTVVLKVDEASTVVSLIMAVCVVAAVKDSPMEVEVMYVRSVVVGAKVVSAGSCIELDMLILCEVVLSA